MNNRLEIGKIVNTHGIRGDVKVTPWCDDPTIFEKIEYVYNKDDRAYRINDVKYIKGSIILSLDEICNMDEAESLKNTILFVERDELGSLPKGVYYIQDLIGLDVHTEDGKRLGKLIDCMQTGSNDVYIVKPSKGKDILLPAIKQVIKDIDLNNNTMTVNLIEGLLDDEV